MDKLVFFLMQLRDSKGYVQLINFILLSTAIERLMHPIKDVTPGMTVKDVAHIPFTWYIWEFTY